LRSHLIGSKPENRLNNDYEIVSLPKSRLATLNVGKLSRNKHYVFGLLEVDVALARRAARALRTLGTAVSFSAWMIKAIGNSIARNRNAHSVCESHRERRFW
jgi:hypothetical protein